MAGDWSRLGVLLAVLGPQVALHRLMPHGVFKGDVAVCATMEGQRLRRLVSAEVAAPEAAPEDGAGAIIARLADGQRGELVVRQLKRLEPGTYARLLREGAAHLSREEIRAAQGAADLCGAQIGRATRSRDA